MIKTYNDLKVYCENFQYSSEYYDLVKESMELDLMQCFIEGQYFVQYTESAALLDDVFMEVINPEKLTSIVNQVGTKAAAFGSKVIQKVKDLIPRMIRFFKAFAKKIMNKNVNAVTSEEIRKAIETDGSVSKAYGVYRDSLVESKISTNPESPLKNDNEIFAFIQTISDKKSTTLYDLNKKCAGLANPKDIATLLSKVTFGNKSRTDRRLVKLTNSITVLLDRSEIDRQCTDLEIALDNLTKNIDRGMLDVSDKGAIVQQIISRKIRGEDAIRDLWKRKEINSQRIGKSYDKKRPESEWNDDYLTKLFYSVVAESFNLDFLLYVDKVAEYVSRKNPARVIRANRNATKYNAFDQVDALKQLYQIAASTLDFYNRFAIIYDATINFISRIHTGETSE